MKTTRRHCRKEINVAGNISRDICTACAMEMTREQPRSVGNILNLINEPVFLIDPDGAVQGANKSASDMLSKELPDIEGHMGGDAFECSYAVHEGGCGKTVHCKACAIRNIVMDTLHSGHGYDKVPAYQSISTPDGPSIIRFILTTEKFGGMVLLRIDSARKGYSA